MQLTTTTLGDLRDYIEQLFTYIHKTGNSEDFNLMKNYSEKLAQSLQKNIEIKRSLMVMLPNSYPLPDPCLQIFLELKSRFDGKLANFKKLSKCLNI